jgi:hypothetical protein
MFVTVPKTEAFRKVDLKAAFYYLQQNVAGHKTSVSIEVKKSTNRGQQDDFE